MRRILLITLALFSFGSMAAWAGSPPPVGPADKVEGNPAAPVTVIEYFSLDCPHCARWAAEIYPKVKADFIDTGKVRFVRRDFPLHGAALQAAELAHCVPDEYDAFVDTLLASQANWLPYTQGIDTVAELGKIAKLGGISDEKFKACLQDKSISEAIVRTRAAGDQAGVTGTPYFFFSNGATYNGELPYDGFAKMAHDAGA